MSLLRVHSSTKTTGYSSEFDGFARRRRDPFNFTKPKRQLRPSGRNHGSSSFNEAVSKSARAADRVRSNAYQRHLDFIKNYAHNYGNESMKKYACLEGGGIKTDWDVLAEEHRFVRTAEEDELAKKNWGKRLAKRYYDKLFKEYALADMRYYKKGQVGLRWRTQKEVVHGKGQFECGNLRCTEPDGLESFEVNFAYKEGNPPQRKNTLVKLRLCPACGYKLNYKKMKAAKKRAKKQLRKELRRAKRRRTDTSTSSHAADTDAPSRSKRQKHADATKGEGEREKNTHAPKPARHSSLEKGAAAIATNAEGGSTSKKRTAKAEGASVWSAPKRQEKDEMDVFLDSLMP